MSTGVEEPEQNVAAHSGIVSGMTLLSRISGLVRDMVLSYFFGAQTVADAFFVAFRIPNFFRRLFAEGAFNQAFVPVLARYRAGGIDELRAFVAVVEGNLSLALIPVVALGVLFAPALVMVFAPGFWGDDVRFEMASNTLRVTFPYLGFISLTAFAGAVLNSHNRYASPAITPTAAPSRMVGDRIAPPANGRTPCGQRCAAKTGASDANLRSVSRSAARSGPLITLNASA